MKHHDDPIYDAPPDTSDCTALMREAGAGIYLDHAKLIAAWDEVERRCQEYEMAQLMRDGVKRWVSPRGRYGFVMSDWKP